MRNLALQGETRYVIPRQCDGHPSNIHIVAVMQNTSTYLHISPSQNAFTSGDESRRLNDPPVSFVLTSDGYLTALDTVGRKIWIVDLEKVADDSSDDGGNENGGGNVSDAHLKSRSQWFYAGSFLDENSPDAMGVDRDDIMDIHLASEGGLYVTCLSHAGHVISVSIDATNIIASKGGTAEEGSECIGTFENGLESGGWSPDGEVLALVTFASEEDEDGSTIGIANSPDAKVPILITMNTQYETLAEIRLDPCLIPLHSSNIDDSPLSNSISMCWRPDNSALAVSTVDVDVNNKPVRRIRTYNRTTLQILSSSKEEDGSGRDVPNLLPVPPTWAPSGGSHYVGAVQSSRSISTKSTRSRQVAMQVAFMEPNGLRHRECKIHNTNAAITDKEDVIGVAFNLEGDLLSVTSMVTTGDTASNQQYQYGKVQFYHSSNYHWYLKYELRYNGNARTGPSVVTNTKFSEEDPYQILIALKQKKDGALEWREYTFRWEASTIHYCDNNWLPTSSSVLAMSIDGKTLNFTALDKAIIPPPMYASSLELPAPAVGIATRPCFYNEVVNESKRADVIIALSDGRLALLQYGGGEGGNSKPSITPGFQPPLLLAVIDPFSIISSDESDDSGLHLQGTVLRDISVINAMDDSLTVVALTSSQGTSGEGHHFDILFEVKVSWIAQSETPKIMIVSSLSLEGRALRVVSWSDTIISPGARGSALVELIDGSLLKYSQGGILEPCGAGPLLEPCPWIAGIYDAHKASTTSSAASKDTPPVDDETSEHLVIGLSSRYRLYSGERLLSNASSSFVISLQHKFLSHVTIGSQPQLKFLPLAALCDFDPLQGSDDQNAMLDGYEPRSVERGARLVAFFQTLPIIVLQMPRGNLEGITPRACLLPYIMLKILKGDFLTALDIMRRQRVDLNLIVDIDPHSFLEKGGAEQFVGQIEKIDNVNLFLSSLIDVDTTLWKYPVPPWIHDEMGSSSTLRQFTAGKVNAVCQKMRNVLLDAEKNGKTSIGKDIKKGHFLLPILSTFAKENPPKLEEALELIKNHASSDSSKARVVHKSKKFDEAIAYLAYLADYELIFNTAIGMYDFDLAKAVARHSQMDPKVYLPLLKHWRELPEAIARYEVDVKLKRYESALRHLVASKEVKEEPPDEDEVYVANCLKFIEEQNLYSLGLELFRDEKNIYRSIMVSLGERLLVDKKPRDALTIFLTANPSYLDGGKRASLACNDWRTFFACCAENEESVGVDQATAIAESISSQVGNLRDQRENFASAATILLEYAVDVSYAIDMLISAHLWSEGRRVAYLCKRLDLVRKVVDGSYTYARTCIEDLGERASLFVKANDRYYEVIVIRREAIGQSEEMNDIHLDDSESVFSMQSTSSITSLRSIASGTSIGSVGSVGTAASVSTVISVGAASSFSFTGEVDAMKHKSKFNRLGRDSKKKKRPKKKGPAARRIKPGSEEELRELVATLNHACPDDDYIDVICETITFLLESEKHAMAKLLFESYKDIESAIAQSQNARLMQDMKTRTHLEQKEREGGYKSNFTQHPCEQDIDTLVCKPLQDSIQNVMSKLSL